MTQKSKNGTAFFERGSWYHRIRWYDEDYLVRYGKKGGFKTEEEAEESYTKYLELFEEQKRNLMRRKDTTIEFTQYLQEWLQYQNYFQSNTKKVYQYVLGQALPYMQKIKLCAVNELYLETAIQKISNRTESYGLKLYELFSMALSDAFSESLIEYNPMKECKRPKRKKIELHILNEQQKSLFIRGAKHSSWYLEILLCMFCGMKRGELYALRFDDFNMKEQTVTISHQVGAEYVKKEDGKYICIPTEKEIEVENARRILKVPKIIMEELENRRIRNKDEEILYGYGYQEYHLISCQKNGNYRSLASMNASLKRICKQVGIPAVTTQDLRDMYAEMMLKSENVSFLKLTALMGYSSIEETYERYSDLLVRDEEQNEYINQIFSEKGIF